MGHYTTTVRSFNSFLTKNCFPTDPRPELSARSLRSGRSRRGGSGQILLPALFRTKIKFLAFPIHTNGKTRVQIHAANRVLHHLARWSRRTFLRAIAFWGSHEIAQQAPDKPNEENQTQKSKQYGNHRIYKSRRRLLRSSKLANPLLQSHLPRILRIGAH